MMKKLLLLILLPIALYSQQDSTVVTKPCFSLIGLNKLNVAYKGIPNPISIQVKETKPFKIKGEAIVQASDGSYTLQPKNGKETKVFVEINTSDSTKVIEEHIFRVKDLPLAALLVNQKGCINSDCVLEIPTKELLNAEISFKLIDFLLDYKISVTGFRLYLTNNSGEFLDSFDIKGNKIPSDVYESILKNDKANLIVIHKMTFSSDLNLAIAKTPMIKIKKV